MAFYPQANRQTERQNNVLDQYLWSYVNYKKDDWAPFLALAKFANNAPVCLSTDEVPFEIVYGEMPRLNILTLNKVKKYIVTRESYSGSESLIEKIYAICKEVIKSLIYA